MSAIALTLDSDIQILTEFRQGSRELAATTFVRKHQRFVVSVAFRQLNSMDDAQDAAQEVFIRALQAVDGFNANSTLKTWLYRITLNVCSNMRRKSRLLSLFTIGEGLGQQDVAAVQLLPDQHREQQEFAEFFKSVLAKLPRKQRETFALRYYDELSYEEISSLVGTSVGALKANYHWAVKKIAEILKTTEYYENWHNNEQR